MIRLFVQDSLKDAATICVPEKQAHYLRHVMRLQAGEKILVFNGVDGEWCASLLYRGKKETLLMVEKQVRAQIDLKPCVLAFALIKKENTALVLQKATELGVTEIYPMITQRSVVRSLNIDRAKAIIHEAAEQCERLDVPRLHEVMPLNAFLTSLPPEITPVHLAERREAACSLSPDIFPVFIVGPEGGFTPEENRLIAQTPRIKTLHLGQTILRAETASIAVLSAWQFRLF